MPQTPLRELHNQDQHIIYRGHIWYYGRIWEQFKHIQKGFEGSTGICLFY